MIVSRKEKRKKENKTTDDGKPNCLIWVEEGHVMCREGRYNEK